MKTIIIGGGLSGLYAAYRLQEAGEDYLLLEASDSFGGRARGWQVKADHELELGATWFWDDFNPRLKEIIDDLGLSYFPQPTGRVIYDSYEKGQVFLNRPYTAGQRLVGGMSQVILALKRKLDPSKLYVNQEVTHINLGDHVTVLTQEDVFKGDRIFLALPPRIASTITFSPTLPADFLKDWLEQETWMAPHAKYLFYFDKPIWRDQGFTGDIISEKGIMGEVHDISDEQGTFGALFGFSRLSPLARKQLSPEEQLEEGLMQLESYFGPEIRQHLLDSHMKDWTLDPLIATQADQESQGHQLKSAQATPRGQWESRLKGIASEFSPSYSGYLAGAIEAVDLAIASGDT